MSVCGCDGLLRRCKVEKLRIDVTTMIGVNPDQVVQIHIAEIIDAEHHAGHYLSLNTGIHLNRVRSSVIRRQCSERNFRTSRNQIRKEVRIRRFAANGCGSLLIGCLESRDALRCGHTVAGVGT